LKIYLVRHHAVFADRKPSFGIWREEWITKALGTQKCVILCSSFDHYAKRPRPKPVKPGRIYLPSIPYKHNTSFFRYLDQCLFGAAVFIFLLVRAKSSDTIFCAYPTQESSLAAILAGRIKKTKVVMDVRDLTLSKLPKPFPLPELFRLYVQILDEAILALAGTIIFMSCGLKETFLKKYPNRFHRKKIMVISNPIEKAARKNRRAGQPIRTLAFSGNLNQSFDFEFLEMYKTGNPPRVRLLIAGGGTQLPELKSRFGEAPGIRFYGECSIRRIKQIFCRADGFFCFYKGSGFQGHLTNKILHYLSFRKPIFHNLGRFRDSSGQTMEVGIHTTPLEMFRMLKRNTRIRVAAWPEQEFAYRTFKEKIICCLQAKSSCG